MIKFNSWVFISGTQWIWYWTNNCVTKTHSEMARPERRRKWRYAKSSKKGEEFNAVLAEPKLTSLFLFFADTRRERIAGFSRN